MSHSYNPNTINPVKNSGPVVLETKANREGGETIDTETRTTHYGDKKEGSQYNYSQHPAITNGVPTAKLPSFGLFSSFFQLVWPSGALSCGIILIILFSIATNTTLTILSIYVIDFFLKDFTGAFIEDFRGPASSQEMIYFIYIFGFTWALANWLSSATCGLSGNFFKYVLEKAIHDRHSKSKRESIEISNCLTRIQHIYFTLIPSIVQNALTGWVCLIFLFINSWRHGFACIILGIIVALLIFVNTTFVHKHNESLCASRDRMSDVKDSEIALLHYALVQDAFKWHSATQLLMNLMIMTAAAGFTQFSIWVTFNHGVSNEQIVTSMIIFIYIIVHVALAAGSLEQIHRNAHHVHIVKGMLPEGQETIDHIRKFRNHDMALMEKYDRVGNPSLAWILHIMYTMVLCIVGYCVFNHFYGNLVCARGLTFECHKDTLSGNYLPCKPISVKQVFDIRDVQCSFKSSRENVFERCRAECTKEDTSEIKRIYIKPIPDKKSIQSIVEWSEATVEGSPGKDYTRLMASLDVNEA